MAVVAGIAPGTAPEISALQVQYPPRSQAIYACTILFLGYTLAFVDRNVVSLLVVSIEHDLGLSDVQMGLLQGTAFAIFYSLFGFPIAWAVDRFNRRNIVTGGVAVWSLMTCMAGLSRGFLPFFGARVGVGAGEAAILPSATSLIADYFPPAARGRAMGVFASGIYFGAATALIGGGFILHRLHGQTMMLPLLGALQPWQVVLVAAGSLGLPLLVATRFLREPVRGHLRGAGARAGSRMKSGQTGFFATLRRHPRAIVAHFVGFTAMAFAAYGATAWLPTLFMRDYGWTAQTVGTRLGLLALVLGPLGTVAGGLLADRLEKAGRSAGKFLVGALAAVCTFVPAVVLGLASQAGTAFAAAAVVIFCTSLVWGVAPGALQEIVHGSVLGRVVAVYTALLNLVGLGLGPPSIALLGESIAGKHGGLGLAIAIIVPVACVIAFGAFVTSFSAYKAARVDLER